jgi:hypothetical protein
LSRGIERRGPAVPARQVPGEGAPRSTQGGFAKWYEIVCEESNKKYAVKVIEKASLTRSKAREKVLI